MGMKEQMNDDLDKVPEGESYTKPKNVKKQMSKVRNDIYAVVKDILGKEMTKEQHAELKSLIVKHDSLTVEKFENLLVEMQETIARNGDLKHTNKMLVAKNLRLSNRLKKYDQEKKEKQEGDKKIQKETGAGKGGWGIQDTPTYCGEKPNDDSQQC